MLSVQNAVAARADRLGDGADAVRPADGSDARRHGHGRDRQPRPARRASAPTRGLGDPPAAAGRSRRPRGCAAARPSSRRRSSRSLVLGDRGRLGEGAAAAALARRGRRRRGGGGHAGDGRSRIAARDRQTSCRSTAGITSSCGSGTRSRPPTTTSRRSASAAPRTPGRRPASATARATCSSRTRSGSSSRAPLHPGSEIADHAYTHGDGVKDIALRVPDAGQRVPRGRLARRARRRASRTTLEDEFGTVELATIATYGDVVHTFVARNGYEGAYLPGYVAQESPTTATTGSGCSRSTTSSATSSSGRWRSGSSSTSASSG